MLLEASLTCLALNVYHEARNEPLEGQIAVTHVVLNRVEDPRFPDDVCAVVRQGGTRRHRCQFSWYCDGRSDVPRNREAWRRAHVAVALAHSGAADPTHGATYYHAEYVRPSWARAYTVTTTIGLHIFYRRDFDGPDHI